MKKQTITKQNIQRELLNELNKKKTFTIFLTAVLFVSIIFYVIYIAAYINGIDLKNDRLSHKTTMSAVIPSGAKRNRGIFAFNGRMQ